MSNKNCLPTCIRHYLFQSLGRDSVLSNHGVKIGRARAEAVSIPRSGFCFVELALGEPGLIPLSVSIPRSGFCFVEHHPCQADPQGLNGFNPSVGILFCRTHCTARAAIATRGGFNPSVGILFCRTSQRVMRNHWRSGTVSIPRSGFCFVERRRRSLHNATHASFNPSVGILFCRTRRPVPDSDYRWSFNPALGAFLGLSHGVSIPRSGFCFVEPQLCS